ARSIVPDSLDHAGRVTLSALFSACEDDIAGIDLHFEDWVVDPLGGPQVEFLDIPDYTTIRSFDDGMRYVRRTRAMGGSLDAHIANPGRGLAAGRVASRDAVKKTLDELNDILAEPDDRFPLLTPLQDAHAGWNAAERERFARELHLSME